MFKSSKLGKILISAAASLASLSLVAALGHNALTAFGSSTDEYNVSLLTYAVDTGTQHMAVGGMFTKIDFTSNSFLYYVKPASEKVSWALEVDYSSGIKGLAFSPTQGNRFVYGIGENDSVLYFFSVKGSDSSKFYHYAIENSSVNTVGLFSSGGTANDFWAVAKHSYFNLQDPQLDYLPINLISLLLKI